MEISIVESNKDNNFISNYVSIIDEEIIINAENLQVSEIGLKLTLEAKTNTIPSYHNTTSFQINYTNQPPEITYSGDKTIMILRTNSKNLEISMIVFDEEQDEILISANFTTNTNALLPNIEVSQKGNTFTLKSDISEIIVGFMTLTFAVWDKYHLNLASSIIISILVRQVEVVHFQEELPSKIKFIE